MDRVEAKVKRSARLVWEILAIAVACKGLAVFLWLKGYWIFALPLLLVAVMMLWYATKAGLAVCPTPGCGAEIEASTGANRYLMCSRCGEYFEGEVRRIWRMDEKHVASAPMFSVRLPQTDAEPVSQAAISAAPTPALAGEDREVAFKWPSLCCICGKPPVREETVAMSAVRRGARAGGFADEKIQIAIGGVPHCGEHHMGASLGMELGEFVLVFRSYSYRNAFRKLNNLKA